jgi:predicted dienelactone hydrolase
VKNRMIVLKCFAFAYFCLSNLAFGAGFHFDVAKTSAGEPLELAVWYPSGGSKQTLSIGPTSMNVSPDGPIAGDALPMIVISHGTGGSSLSHFDTAIALANAGYVVVAITHKGDNYKDQSRSTDILDRPRQISRVIDYMLQGWRNRASIDAARVGMFGFSAGGFTTLINIGGIADFSKIDPNCNQFPSDFVCMLLATKGLGDGISMDQSNLTESRIRAAVIAAPALGFTFSRDGLKNVQIPLQLWRAEKDLILPHPRYTQVVYDALPVKPDYQQVSNAGHFDFLAPCSKAFAQAVPFICESAPGFDRQQFHDSFNAAVLTFFQSTLK